MKIGNIILFLLIGFVALGQNRNNKTIHIEANTRMFVRVVFPKPIQSFSIGADEEIFLEKEDNTLKIKALAEEAHTNFDVKTSDGLYYSFIVKGIEDTPELFHSVSPAQAVNSNVSLSEVPTSKKETKITKSETTAEPKSNAEKVLALKGYISSWNIKEYKRISLEIKGIYTDAEKLYFLLELQNKSNIRYDIDKLSFISFSIEKSGKKRLKAEVEEYNPLYLYEPITTIDPKTKIKVVAVFDKFTLNNNKKMGIILDEQGGERNVDFEIPSDMITNAQSIN